MGFIFIFNLIVGTGALTLPGVFAKAGWLLSLIVVIMLAIISYMTVTFVIEAMAAANAVKTWQNLQVLKRSYDVGTLSLLITIQKQKYHSIRIYFYNLSAIIISFFYILF